MSIARRILSSWCTIPLVSFVAATPAFAAGLMVYGAEKGDPPRVVVRSNPGTTANDFFPEVVAASFFAFDETFKGGVRVAIGDFDADADLEVATATGSGTAATVKIWDLAPNGELVGLKEAFSTPFSGQSSGLYLAAGDFDNSGKDSLVVSAGDGEARVWIFDDFETVGPGDGLLGNSLVDTFVAFPSNFKRGCRIAMGITNPDNKEDLVCANGPGNSQHLIRIFRDTNDNSMLSDETLLDSFVPSVNGPYQGMYVAVGNISEGTTNGEIAVYMTGGGNSRILTFTDADNDGIFSEAAVDETFTVLPTQNGKPGKSKGGMRIAVANIDGDAGASARFELVTTTRFTSRPDIRLREAGTTATSKVASATATVVPYVDSLITTYFTKVPFVDWSN